MAKKEKAFVFMPVVLADGAVIGGALSVAYGAYQFSPPLGFIVGGLLSMALALMAGVRL